MPKANKVLLKRIQIRSAARPQVIEDAPGIICAGVLGEPDDATVLLLWDEADANPGCSLTNGVEAVLSHLLQTWPAEFPWKACIAIERDSLGDFDILRLDSGGELRFDGWSPARWPGCEPRSWQAVEAMLGDKARLARVAVRELAPECGA